MRSIARVLKALYYVVFILIATSCLSSGSGSSGSSGSSSSSPPPSSVTPPPATGCDSAVPTSYGAIFLIPPSQEIVPLCDGKILIQNQTTNKIGLLDLLNQQTINVWQLNAKPTHMILDDNEKYLYVALEGTAKIAKIDVTAATTNVIYITTSSAASWLALGNNDFLLANLTSSGGYWGNIDLIDIANDNLIKTFSGSYSKLMAYNKSRDELITGTKGLSPASLTRYTYTSATQTLTQVENINNNGSNGQYMVFSPDYQHFIFNTGTGNISSYGLYDFIPSSLATPQGSFSVGAYPKASAFSPDNQYMVATTGTQLKMFNVTTHALTGALTADLSPCSYGEISRVGFSRGGKLVYAYSYCGFNSDSGYLLVVTR